MSGHLLFYEHQRAWLGDGSARTGMVGERLVISDRHLRRLERFERGQEGDIFRWGRRWVGATQWVGVVQVGDLLVEVLPKVDGEEGAEEFWRRNLLFILSLVGELPFRPRDFARQEVGRGPLLEVLIGLFARRLSEELKKGRHQYYVDRQQNMPVLKGKLRFHQHIAQNIARKDRFFVEYQEFLPDTRLNQILKATCEQLRRFSTSHGTRESLRFCLMMLEGVRSGPIGAEDFAQVARNRQNERFLGLLKMCRLFWEGLNPEGRRGESESFALLYDMNVLFERFIAEFIRRYVVSGLGEEATLHTQGSGVEQHLLWRDRVGEERTLRLLPDLVVRRGGETVVVDTKWKRLEGTRSGRQGVMRDDLYQAFAYAKSFGAWRVVLLYPWVRGGVEQVYFVPGEEGATVEVRFVRLDQDLTSGEGVRKVVGQLKEIIVG